MSGLYTPEEMAQAENPRRIQAPAEAEPPSQPDLTKQLHESINWVQWTKDFCREVMAAKTKGAVNEVAAIVGEEAKRLGAPETALVVIRAAIHDRKAEL
jgi:hypothetical protein